MVVYKIQCSFRSGRTLPATARGMALGQVQTPQVAPAQASPPRPQEPAKPPSAGPTPQPSPPRPSGDAGPGTGEGGFVSRFERMGLRDRKEPVHASGTDGKP